MNISGAAEAELRCLAYAKDLLHQHHHPNRTRVVAVALTHDGMMFPGVELTTRKSIYCAEPAAISAARTAGHDTISSIVAVARWPGISEGTIISPCGECRDLLVLHSPRCRVLLLHPDGVATVPAADLLPAAEMYNSLAS